MEKYEIIYKKRYFIDEEKGIVETIYIHDKDLEEKVLEEVKKYKKIIVRAEDCELHNKIPYGTTHFHLSATDFIEPLDNLPSTLEYFSRGYCVEHCFDGFGYEYQLNNFPCGLKVLILNIDKYSSMLNLPSSLEFIFLKDGYKNYAVVDKQEKNKNTIIVPNNVKIFAITNYIDRLYNIIFENTLTKKIIIKGEDDFDVEHDNENDYDFYKQYSEFLKYLPIEYHEFYTESFQIENI